MNKFNGKLLFFINKVSHMFELFSCFEYKINKKGKFSIKLCKKVIMATCCFYSFNDKFLHEIKYVQSLKVMPT